MGIEIIEQDGIVYAEIIWAGARVDQISFYSPPESSFQFGLLAHKAPVWFFSLGAFEDFSCRKYELIEEFNSFDKIDYPSSFKGFIFLRKG